MCKLLPNESLASGLKSYGEKGTLLGLAFPGSEAPQVLSAF